MGGDEGDLVLRLETDHGNNNIVPRIVKLSMKENDNFLFSIQQKKCFFKK
jgi:hypothetical protein